MTVRVEGLATTAPESLPLAWRGRSLLAARLVWGGLILQAGVLFALSVPAQYHRLRYPPPDVKAQLAHAGLPAAVYAGYLTTVGAVFALICGGMAALIVRHRPRDRIGLLASLYLVLLGLVPAPNVQAVALGYPALAWLASFDGFLLALVLIAFFFLFPDGRCVPRWARVPLLVGAAAFTVVFVVTDPSAVDPPDWMGLMNLGGTVVGIAALIFRYARVADPRQRQQIKWVLLGAAVANLAALGDAFFGQFVPTIGRPETGYDLTAVTVVGLASLAIPLTLGLAILRYHLWEIEVVVNRTLVYGALTSGLLAVYLAVVAGLGAVVEGRGRLGRSLLATALVAVLFAPLRHRLQGAVNRLMYGERDDPYRVLTRLGERVGAALAPDAVLAAIAETVAAAIKSPHVAMTLAPEDGPAPLTVLAAGDAGGAPLRLPLEYQGETVGELRVAPRGPGEEFSAADRRLLEDLVRQIGPAAHAVRLAADLQRSRERLVTAREEERRRLRRDLHDGLGPQLAALTLKIETVRNRFTQDRALDAALVDLTERTQAALADIRRLVYGLRPPALDELGLLAALRQSAAQCTLQGERALTVSVDAPEPLPPLSAAVEVAVYRIVQEALANVVRHAGARACRVALALNAAGDRLGLEIADDGRGLPAQYRLGVGLLSMRERAEELGGSWRVTSAATGGTVVAVELPL